MPSGEFVFVTNYPSQKRKSCAKRLVPCQSSLLATLQEQIMRVDEHDEDADVKEALERENPN